MNSGGVRGAFFRNHGFFSVGPMCDVFIPYHTMCCGGYTREIGIDYIVKSSIGRRVGTTKYIVRCRQDTIVGDFRVFISHHR